MTPVRSRNLQAFVSWTASVGNNGKIPSVSLAMHGVCLICWLAVLVLPDLIFSAQDGNAQPGPHVPTFGTTVVLPAGLRGTVYFISKDTQVLPDFEHDPLERAGEIWTYSLNVPPRHWRSGFPGLTDRFEWFAIDYSGKFWVDKPGRYTFALVSDDGSRLFIDDTPVIDNDRQHSPDVRLAAVQLEGGGHRIRVSYFQGPRDCLALVLAVAGPDQAWRVFSTQDFKPPANPDEWNFPAVSSFLTVPVRPEEAALSVKGIFQRLVDADPDEEFLIKEDSAKGCGGENLRALRKAQRPRMPAAKTR